MNQEHIWVIYFKGLQDSKMPTNIGCNTSIHFQKTMQP